MTAESVELLYLAMTDESVELLYLAILNAGMAVIAIGACILAWKEGVW